MNIAELAIGKGTVTWTLSIAVLILGWFSYQGLPRLEDPEFAIKEAVVITDYPGASAKEVEQEVSEKIETGVQGLGQLRRMESYSSRGLSVVSVLVQDRYDRRRLPQVWDELRRKINDLQGELPPGAGPSLVNEDFGDVYGVYYGLVGDGFSPAELKRVAALLQRELSSVQGVKKVILFGEQRETVFVELSKTRLKDRGVTLEEVSRVLRSKNLPVDAGRIRIGPEHVPIDPGRLYRSEQDLRDLMIASSQGQLTRLGDVAEVRRDYEDPPRRLLRIDGRPAIGIALSIAHGGDQVAMGEAVQRRLAALQAEIPIGMKLEVIALQSEALVAAVDDFVISLVQALVIVLLTLLFFLGLRSGLIIGFIALLTMAGAFVVMDYSEMTLERISSGALIIALGLLVDNAILVVDGMKVRMDGGMAGIEAAREVAARNGVPLLGGTAVAILAFASIGGMENSAGEYTRALYLVVLISLSISWVTAVTTAPLLAQRFLGTGASGAVGRADPYGGRFYCLYGQWLRAAIRHRWVVLGGTSLLFLLSLYGFGFVKQIFFPPATTPTFLVEVYFREGTHIRETERQMAELEQYLRTGEGVTRVATAIGQGHPRHLLMYNTGRDVGSHYAVSLVLVDDYRLIDEIRPRLQQDLEQRFPDALVNVRKYVQASETAGGRIRLRISGPDPAELRRMADGAKAIIAADPDAKSVRDDWGAKVKVARPVLAADRARRLGISREQVSDALRTTYSGTVTGYYRDGAEGIPIVARAPLEERSEVEDMVDIPVTSPLTGERVPLFQVVDRLETITEDARLSRRDRRPMITVHADADLGLTFELLERIKPQVEQALGVDLAAYLGREVGGDFHLRADTIPIIQNDRIPIRDKPGYFFAWGGEAENWAESRAELGDSMPLYFGLVVLVLISLFNALRQPLMILLVAPLSMIGVTAGLLLTGQPFGFMSLIGLMGLSGMLIRNAIVLVDQIDRNIRGGKARLTAILDSGIGRLRPVALAAGTTILAMLPLLKDDFFVSMAVTMMFGLGLATILTLLVVPVLYAVLFGIGNEETDGAPTL